MFTDIPFSFRNKNEDYFIINKLQQFCNENGLSTTLDKVDLLNSIVEFGKVNEDNGEKVLQWIELCLKEGIKKILTTSIQATRDIRNRNYEEWEEIIKRKFNLEACKYIIQANHINEIKLCNYKITMNDNKTEKISFNFTILLKEQKGKEEVYNKIIYPIFVDLYVQSGYIVGRSKSKSSLFKYIEGNDDEESLQSVNCDNLIIESFSMLYEKLDIKRTSIPKNTDLLKKKVHAMVEECTKTPSIIIDKLKEENDFREKFVKNFFARQSISVIEDDYYLDALKDLEIFMEKYLSISTNDKSIFTNEKYGYPIQIAATDEDFSSLEETSSEDTPLQCTPIFFDNKRLIEKQKRCDNVLFIFKKEPKLYFPKKNYRCIMKVLKGYLYIEFRKYVLEEDIENVLSRIIRSN